MEVLGKRDQMVSHIITLPCTESPSSNCPIVHVIADFSILKGLPQQTPRFVTANLNMWLIATQLWFHFEDSRTTDYQAWLMVIFLKRVAIS